MKKLAKTFIKVGRILDLVLGIIAAIASVVLLVIFVIDIFLAIAEEITWAAAFNNLYDSIKCIFFVAFCIFDLCSTNALSKKLEVAKSKADVKKEAIVTIVSGVLSCQFSAVAGILLLVAPETVYTTEETVAVEDQSQVVDEQPKDVE